MGASTSEAGSMERALGSLPGTRGGDPGFLPSSSSELSDVMEVTILLDGGLPIEACGAGTVLRRSQPFLGRSAKKASTASTTTARMGQRDQGAVAGLVGRKLAGQQSTHPAHARSPSIAFAAIPSPSQPAARSPPPMTPPTIAPTGVGEEPSAGVEAESAHESVLLSAWHWSTRALAPPVPTSTSRQTCRWRQGTYGIRSQPRGIAMGRLAVCGL